MTESSRRILQGCGYILLTDLAQKVGNVVYETRNGQFVSSPLWVALIGMETVVVTQISRRLEGYGEAEFTGSG